jgi:hypothetical protein
MWVLILMIVSTGLSAQSLQILPSPPARGETSFRIMLASPADKAPLALQWNLALPEGVVFHGIIPGEAATSVQKSVTCSAVPLEKKDDRGSQYRCLLAGGQSPVPDGPLVAVTCHLREGLREATVYVKQVIGVSRDSQKMILEDTQATIAAAPQ